MSAVAAAAPSRSLPGRLLRTLSDERLVARVRLGDQAAFEVVYDRYHRSLLSFCRHMLGNAEEAEDALQQVCISAYNGLLGDDRPIQLKAWLFTIARNRCLTMLRARREHADVDDVQPAVEGLASEVQRREDLREMLADLQSLPDDQRAALVLTELRAHTHEEVAVILDVRKEKVKALVFQAREQLLGARKARETDCSEIREQLSTLRGGALRRTQLRKHVESCAGCAAFKLEVQRQRAAMAVLLPVVPGAALKSSVLAGVFGGGGAGAAGIGGGGAAIAGSGAAAGGLAAATGTGGGVFAALGAQGVAVKALAALAVAGGAGGTSYVAVQEVRAQSDPAPRAVVVPPAVATPAAPAATVAAQPPQLPPAASATAVSATGRAGAAGRRRTAERSAAGKAKGKARREATRRPTVVPAAGGPATPASPVSAGRPATSQAGSRPATAGRPAKRGATTRPARPSTPSPGRVTAKVQAQPKARQRPASRPAKQKAASPVTQTKKDQGPPASSNAGGASGKEKEPRSPREDDGG